MKLLSILILKKDSCYGICSVYMSSRVFFFSKEIAVMKLFMVSLSERLNQAGSMRFSWLDECELEDNSEH